MNSSRAYRTLLRLYPNDYRARFAAPMQYAFDRESEERRLLGGPVFLRFLLREISGLLIGIAVEWIAKATTDKSIRGRSLPDIRMMRPPGVPRELWFAGMSLNTLEGHERD